jgi:hypothetical protein
MTMATITVEGIPDWLLVRLRIATDGSGRSLSREVVVQLARSFGCSRNSGAARGSRPGLRCVEGSGCHCNARRVEMGAVGWGGPISCRQIEMSPR